MMEHAKDLLVCIPSVLPRFYGAEKMKSIAVHKIKKYIVLMEKVTLFANSKNIVIGLIQCPYQLSMSSREDVISQGNFYRVRYRKSKKPLSFTINPSNNMDKDL